MQIPPMVPLRALREAHGLSSPELAKRIAEFGVTVDPDSILAVELGQTGVSDKLLRAWARALKIRPLDIRRPQELREALLDEAAEA